MTPDQPITYVDVDPLIPTHLGTSAPHVHHRGSDRCLRNVDGPECLSGEALRVRVAELEAEVEGGKRLCRRLSRANERLEAERDALQQRLDAVQALADEFAHRYVASNRPSAVKYTRDEANYAQGQADAWQAAERDLLAMLDGGEQA